MTRQRYDDKGSNAELWRRRKIELSSAVGFDAQDLDFIWHDFKHGRIMTVEDKERMGLPTFSQRDTQGIIAQALEIGFKKSLKRLNPHQPKNMEYTGHYLVQYENTSPSDGFTVVSKFDTSSLKFIRPKKLDETAYIDFLQTMLI